MKKLVLFIALSFTFLISQGAKMKVDNTSLDFGSVALKKSKTLSFKVTGSFVTDVKSDFLDTIKSYGNGFSYSFTYNKSNSLTQNDSVIVNVTFTPTQNITYKGYIHISSKNLLQNIAVPVMGKGLINDTFYQNSTFDKWDEDLKAVLRAKCSTHTQLGYNTARDKMYADIDQFEGNDTIQCVYTGRRALFTTRSGAVTNNMNCEHTFPQSKFSSKEPILSDIWHLYPVDENANTKRSNDPFGVVASPTWNVGGSKWGSSVFEPRDDHKGDAARSLFYVCIMYQDFSSFVSGQESILRKWHSIDTPSTKELSRAVKIEKYQKNKNPLIDQPQFVDRIFSITSNTSRSKVTDVYYPFEGKQIYIGKDRGNGNASLDLFMFNEGNAATEVVSFRLKNLANSTYKSVISTSIIDSNLEVLGASNNQLNIANFASNASYKDTLVTILGNGKVYYNEVYFSWYSGIEDERVVSASEVQVFPNPSNGELNIQSLESASKINSVQLINSLGQVLINSKMGTGNSTKLDISSIEKGVYFLKININHSEVFKRVVRM